MVEPTTLGVIRMPPTKGTLVASMPVKMSRGEIEAEVIYKLKRRRCWGEKYLPIDSLVSWIGNQVLRDGDEVREAVDDMIKKGLLLPRKKGKTVSLNPTRITEIESFLRKHGY
ncbi:MAG: hypothetical protein Q8O47_06970 [Candidatus Bathyarchaeota archaeon]|nr:hypothetical protein [Candidatus Bathyarchaeota archaeon]